jgi:hypothetical protein
MFSDFFALVETVDWRANGGPECVSRTEFTLSELSYAVL